MIRSSRIDQNLSDFAPVWVILIKRVCWVGNEIAVMMGLGMSALRREDLMVSRTAGEETNLALDPLR